jgi:hypothetical protein
MGGGNGGGRMAIGGGGRSFGGGSGVMNRGNIGNPGVIGPGRGPGGIGAGRGPGLVGSNYAGYRPGYGGRRGYGGAGRGFGLGFATGALIGAAPYYYGSGYGYDDYAYADDGYDDGYVAAPAYGGDRDDAYCLQRFQSYDPRSGTYLGYDGLRHPCP